VKHVSVDMLTSLTVLHTVGGSTGVWQPATGHTGLFISATKVLYKDGMTQTKRV
jgi:hypothetical protein